MHFNERPFLNHKCYLYLTKTTKERMRMQSSFSSLCRGFIIPKEVDKDTTAHFLDTVGQFARIVNDTGLVHLSGSSVMRLRARRIRPDWWRNISVCQWKIPLRWKTSNSEMTACVSATSTFRYIRYRNWMRCPTRWVRTAGMKGCQRTKATASCHSPVR